MKTLIIAEHDNQQLKPATYHAVSAAEMLKTDIDMCVIGSECGSVVEQINIYVKKSRQFQNKCQMRVR
jgi:electron transfer flavoprotein alpha subunit